MAVTYKKDEILSASRVARSSGKVLTDLKAQHRRRVVVIKNNEVEAVIMPGDDYEKIAEALDLFGAHGDPSLGYTAGRQESVENRQAVGVAEGATFCGIASSSRSQLPRAFDNLTDR